MINSDNYYKLTSHTLQTDNIVSQKRNGIVEFELDASNVSSKAQVTEISNAILSEYADGKPYIERDSNLALPRRTRLRLPFGSYYGCCFSPTRKKGPLSQSYLGSPDVYSRVTDMHDNMFAKFNNRRYKASKIKYDTEILSIEK